MTMCFDKNAGGKENSINKFIKEGWHSHWQQGSYAEWFVCKTAGILKHCCRKYIFCIQYRKYLNIRNVSVCFKKSTLASHWSYSLPFSFFCSLVLWYSKTSVPTCFDYRTGMLMSLKSVKIIKENTLRIASMFLSRNEMSFSSFKILVIKIEQNSSIQSCLGFELAFICLQSGSFFLLTHYCIFHEK